MRSWRPKEVSAYEHWKMKKQTVVSQVYKQKILEMADERNLAGHLGIKKTSRKILIRRTLRKIHVILLGQGDVVECCKTFVLCQKVSRPN